jgi:hypothetical protein
LIAPAFTLYVDEAGSPVFTAKETDARGYVVAAVCVPATAAPQVTAILPRSHGRLLKSSDHAMTPKAAADFVSNLLVLPVDLALVLIDTAGTEVEQRAREATEATNERRKLRRNPPVNTVDLVYMLALKDAIIGAWHKTSARLGAPLSFFDMVLDTASIRRHSQKLLEEILHISFSQRGLVCREVSWKSEADAPLLLVADIIAGVYRRQVTHHDVVEAWKLIEDAACAGRITLQDGMTSDV